MKLKFLPPCDRQVGRQTEEIWAGSGRSAGRPAGCMRNDPNGEDGRYASRRVIIKPFLEARRTYAYVWDTDGRGTYEKLGIEWEVCMFPQRGLAVFRLPTMLTKHTCAIPAGGGGGASDFHFARELK